VCAAPEYLAKNEEPAEPQELARHTIIVSMPVSPASEWHFVRAKKPITVRIQPRLTVTNNDAAIQAVLSGFGITRLMSYQIAGHMAAGRLKRILADYEAEPLPIHVLHREGRQASAKVRSFVDFLVERLRSDLALT